MEIGEILKRIKDRGLFKSITRHDYLDYDADEALKVLEVIGKSRKPDFSIDDNNKFLYGSLIRWIHGDPKLKAIDPFSKKTIKGNINAGIYIAGSTGTGKSWALEIASAYVAIYNLRVGIGDKDVTLRWDNVRTDEICNEYTTKGDLQKYKTKPLLGLQDLGSEQAESVYMGNRLKPLQQILEYRGDRTDVITLISSNLPINHEELKTRYGDRVSSRLSEMCNYYELKGVDRRNPKERRI